jgi:hypothetical protein
LDGDQLEAFHRALACCYENRWAEALEIFSALDDDPVAEVYAKRCRKLMEDPTSVWDGVWNLTQK